MVAPGSLHGSRQLKASTFGSINLGRCKRSSVTGAFVPANNQGMAVRKQRDRGIRSRNMQRIRFREVSCERVVHLYGRRGQSLATLAAHHEDAAVGQLDGRGSKAGRLHSTSPREHSGDWVIHLGRCECLALGANATRHQHTAVRQSCGCVQSARDRHGPCVCKSPRTRMAGAGLKPGRCYNGTEIRWRGHGRLSFALQSWTKLNRDTSTCNPQTRNRCLGEWNPIQEMQKAHNSATSRSSNTATILIAQQPPPCSDRYSIKYHTDVLTPPSEACIIRWIHADSRESVGQFSLK